METEIWAGAQKSGYGIIFFEALDYRWQVQVGETVGVISEEDFFLANVFLHGFQALADIRIDPGVGEGDIPIVNVAIREQNFFAAFGKNEIVGEALFVIQEKSFYGLALMAEAEDEVFVAVVRIIFHHVPEHGALADGHERLGNALGVVADAQA